MPDNIKKSPAQVEADWRMSRKLAEIVKDYCKRTGINATHLADTSGIMRSYMSQIRKGETRTGQPNDPPMSILIRLANGMGISVTELLQQIQEDGVSSPAVDQGQTDRMRALGYKVSRIIDGERMVDAYIATTDEKRDQIHYTLLGTSIPKPGKTFYGITVCESYNQIGQALADQYDRGEITHDALLRFLAYYAFDRYSG